MFAHRLWSCLGIGRALQGLPNLTGLYLVSLAYLFLKTGKDNCREKRARQNHLVIPKREDNGIED